MKPEGSTAAIFELQWLHALAAVAGLVVLWLISRGCPCFHRGELWGVGTWTWFWIAVEVPIVHQLLVWFCWRTELHRGLISGALGRTGFAVYAALFTVLLVGRLVVITALAVASRESLAVNHTALKLAAVVGTIPVAYLAYSVVRYFGIARAYGADHFDPGYRTRPLVREGIFRWTSNGMYTYGFLVLYLPALWFASRPALVAAVFSHLFIWVHYLTTERPDMRRIYGTRIGA